MRIVTIVKQEYFLTTDVWPGIFRQFIRYISCRLEKCKIPGVRGHSLLRDLFAIDRYAIYLGAVDATAEFIHGALASTAARMRMKRGSH